MENDKRLYKDKIDKKIETIYDKIVERFPAGRMSAYIINNAQPDVHSIVEDLKSTNYDSDKRYRDEQSIQDARNFAKQLEELLKI